jgi:hypothetical protein
MFYPYARIIPMHVVVSSMNLYVKSEGDLVLFLVLKTFADAIMHVIEHQVLRKGELREG